MITSVFRRPLCWRLLLSAIVLLSTQPAAADPPDDASAELQEGYPPLGTEVMVLDLEALADEAARAAAWAQTLRRYTDAPAGPSVDTPSRPSVPALALRPAEPIEPPPVTTLQIMLDGYPSPRHAALFVARERGLFASRGLDVTLANPADPDVPSKLLAASRIDLAVSRQPLLHLQVDRGLPLVRVASLIATPLSALVVREDGTIETPAQLAGSRIGHADIDSRDVLLAALLKGAAIRDDEVETEALNFRLGDALREGRVDGVIGAMRHRLPRELADEGLATRVLRIEALGIPLHDGLVLLANRDHLGPQREAIRRLVATLEEATAWIANHPDEAWALLASAEPALDTAVNREGWDMVRGRLNLSPAALDQGRYRRFEDYLFEAGLIQERHPVSRLAIDPGASPR
ncbi:putative hydroxymethylpyrimidine transport system substrate-binding protein [Halomonas fontilapidosi]|uniref:Putative hydroxymethylpyrimidine transport system substrate-binding protein n=1 Tax=Halomonas fontilapidosi TaxID=616675 RepID=A0A7W5DHD3_9GAMM|nr:ABC transporter substrate-binding protein [Halomonas fontilapidosi]MBB3182550.1 putative hydroxymethylpyrimidine transport system substrate-binding protein [Halomonas fontilapidosi]